MGVAVIGGVSVGGLLMHINRVTQQWWDIECGIGAQGYGQRALQKAGLRKTVLDATRKFERFWFGSNRNTFGSTVMYSGPGQRKAATKLGSSWTSRDYLRVARP
jgi:hypothetical protein